MSDPDWLELLHVAEQVNEWPGRLPDPMLRHRLDADQRLKEGREARAQTRRANRSGSLNTVDPDSDTAAGR